MNKTTEITSTIPPTDILKINIINRRNVVLFELEKYYSCLLANSSPPTHKLLACVRILFIDVECSYKSQENDYKEVAALCLSDDITKCITGFRVLNNWMYKKGLIKFDTRGTIDPRIVEEENRVSGL